MSWIYFQTTGNIYRDKDYAGNGYSGAGNSKNRPRDEKLAKRGPIPKGEYKIGRSYAHKEKGPVTMNLDPVGHNAQGRTAFRIHGDSKKHPGQASEGCIILNRMLRDRISASGDTQLIVEE